MTFGRTGVWLAVFTTVFLALLAWVAVDPQPLPGDVGITSDVQGAFGVVPVSVGTGEAVLLFVPLIGAIAFLVLRRRWRSALWLFGSIAFCTLVVGIIQLIVGRGSFPSVGIAQIMVLAVLVACLGWQWHRIPVAALASAEVVIACVFVIDVAGHRPSEVLGGLAFGGAWATGTLAAADRWKQSKRRTVPAR